MKVVINRCYGGFNLSKYAELWLQSKGYTGSTYNIPRHHPLLVECVQTLGKEASGKHAALVIQEVTDKYSIEYTDGFEELVTPELLMERIRETRWITANQE